VVAALGSAQYVRGRGDFTQTMVISPSELGGVFSATPVGLGSGLRIVYAFQERACNNRLLLDTHTDTHTPPVTSFFPLMSISSLWQRAHLLPTMHTANNSEKNYFQSYLPLNKSYKYTSDLLHFHKCVNTDCSFFSLHIHDITPESHKPQMSENSILNVVHIY